MPRSFGFLRVEAVHHGNRRFDKQHFGGVGSRFHDFVEQLTILFAGPLENPVGALHTARGLTDADAQTNKVS